MSNTNTQDYLGTESISKLLVKFSIPAIIGMLVNMLYNVIDRIYISNIPDIGGLAITGIGITLPITTIITAFGMLIGIGACSNISIAYGKNRKDEAEKFLGNGTTCIIIISIFIAILGNLFAEPILTLFGASKNTLPYAAAYICPLFTGTIFNLFAFGLNNSIRSDGNPKLSMLTMVIGAIVNIVLDPIFIFNFNLGIKGAAYATILSQFIATCWVLYYFTKSKKSSIKITLNGMKLDKATVISILMIGLSPFLMQVANSIVSVIANRSLMTYGGDLAIGAMTIITSIASLFIMPVYGLNQGSQPIIGYNYGAKKYDRVRKTYIYSLVACTVILCLSGLFIQLFPKIAISLFNKDKELTDITVNGMRLYLLSMPLIGIQMTASNYYQAVGKAKKAMIISLTRQLIFLIPAFLILPKLFNLNGVWLAGPTADVLAIIVSSIIIFKEMRSLKEIPVKENINNYKVA